MSMYFERSNIKEYPGAGVIIPGDLEAGDCNQWPSLQLLVQELNRGIGGILRRRSLAAWLILRRQWMICS